MLDGLRSVILNETQGDFVAGVWRLPDFKDTQERIVQIEAIRDGKYDEPLSLRVWILTSVPGSGRA